MITFKTKVVLFEDIHSWTFNNYDNASMDYYLSSGKYDYTKLIENLRMYNIEYGISMYDCPAAIQTSPSNISFIS